MHLIQHIAMSFINNFPSSETFYIQYIQNRRDVYIFLYKTSVKKF